jgi:hypothetical protein
MDFLLSNRLHIDLTDYRFDYFIIKCCMLTVLGRFAWLVSGAIRSEISFFLMLK